MENESAKGAEKKNQRAGSQPAQKALDIDPVCGMDVDGTSANPQRVQRNGTTYSFCSSDCRKQFEAAPEDFGA